MIEQLTWEISAIFRSGFFGLGMVMALVPILPALADNGLGETDSGESPIYGVESIKLGANMDLFAASRNFGPENGQAELKLREVELSLSKQVRVTACTNSPFTDATATGTIAMLISELIFHTTTARYCHSYRLHRPVFSGLTTIAFRQI